MNDMNPPKLKIPKTKFEKGLNIVALIFFVAVVTYVISVWQQIPNRVPTHFTLSGAIDSWGNKGTLFVTPIIGIILWLPIHLFEKIPHLYSYIVKLTEENMERQYLNARMMVNVLKNTILFIFSYICIIMVISTKIEGIPFGYWQFVVMILIILGPMSYFIWRSYKLR